MQDKVFDKLMHHDLPFDMQSLRSAYAAGVMPKDVIEEVYRRIKALDDPGIFLLLRDENDVLEDARELGSSPAAEKPLWGIPFVIKDNIDAAGLTTTAGCPDFAYTAEVDAFVVARLCKAGALLIGKTNLDQFATGLVGVRTHSPIPTNAIDPAIIPGGSSSGSAVAVAQGLVSFSLGTDTAGSGRVPAALNGIVGLKPSLGALSNHGVVPACRTLDCVSVFALTADDAFAVFEAAIAYNSADPYSKNFTALRRGAVTPHVRVGVPDTASRRFFGDDVQAASFESSLQSLLSLGAEISEIDFKPFYAVAEMLYDGPWVAERYTVIEDLLKHRPGAIHPVTRQVTEVARRFSATDTFRAIYALRELSRNVAETMDSFDMLCVPSVPKFFTRREVDADPIVTNAQLGTYTNFVNLLDMCALTVPTAARQDGRPGSVTLIGPAGTDGALGTVAAAIQQITAPALGATNWPLPPALHSTAVPEADETEIVVVGAHMSGLPLNRELTERGGRFLRVAKTAPNYRLFKLSGGPPIRPGLVRQPNGNAIVVEIWALPTMSVGAFLSGIPSPLGLGVVTMENGDQVTGFLCEQIAIEDAEDITHFGGWRAFLQSLSLDQQPDKELHHATS